MKIDCYFSMGCGSEVVLRKNIPDALAAEGLKAEVNYRRIADEAAEKLGLRGSPTIMLDGVDLFPSEISGFS
ncbi:MAG TPA: hypothetical protein ENH32_00570 [Proteobacteria bacterium]|nr:hypothetical protein BMS3Abin14_01930 [bacterium BMS3Abin14]HDL52453.1 hypothetical protein [Pseudomonadota bacterium]